MTENTTTPKLPRIGITHGDLNGVGYEIILKAFGDPRMLGMMTPILYGQSKALSYYKKNFGMDDFNYSLTRDASQSWNQKFNIFNIVDEELKIEPGVATALSMEMAMLSHKKAVEDLQNGILDAVVMAPSHPVVERSNAAFLRSTNKGSDMMRLLVSDRMRIGLVTDDIPLREALAQIDVKTIARKLLTLNDAIKRDFNIKSPKVAVLGLDPHGSEIHAENDMTALAISEVKGKGVLAFGPFMPSQLFSTGLWRKYDAVLALYHEQAYLPFSMLSIDGGSYYWAGLPTVCAAPLQEPEFSIANTNHADPAAFRCALYLALDILTNRSNSKPL